MIKLCALECGYQTIVLRNLDIEFSVAETVVLLGANGSGKSCLLETIVGKIEPLKGHVEGVPKAPKELAKILAYAEQSPIEGHQLKVKDYFSLIEPKDLVQTRELVEYFSLTELLQRPLYALSGGQRQLVRLCATLMQEARFYLLDEPTNSLDPRPVELLLKRIKQMRQAGKSFILVTHELPFAVALGERFIGLKDEKIIFDCDVEELEDNRHLDQLFERRFEWVKLSDGRKTLC